MNLERNGLPSSMNVKLQQKQPVLGKKIGKEIDRNLKAPKSPSIVELVNQGKSKPVMKEIFKGTEEWEKLITSDLRNLLVYKVVQAIFPNHWPEALFDRRMHCLVSYASKIESQMYEIATNKTEYFHLLAEKICKIKKGLEKKT